MVESPCSVAKTIICPRSPPLSPPDSGPGTVQRNSPFVLADRLQPGSPKRGIGDFAGEANVSGLTIEADAAGDGYGSFFSKSTNTPLSRRCRMRNAHPVMVHRCDCRASQIHDLAKRIGNPVVEDNRLPPTMQAHLSLPSHR